MRRVLIISSVATLLALFFYWHWAAGAAAVAIFILAGALFATVLRRAEAVFSEEVASRLDYAAGMTKRAAAAETDARRKAMIYLVCLAAMFALALSFACKLDRLAKNG